MEVIFNEKDKNLECINDIIRKCRTDAYIKNSWYGVSAGAICYIDKKTNDILVLFREDQLPVENPNIYAAAFISDLKNSLNNSGFEVVEDRISEPEEFKNIKFKTHLFRLRTQ